MELTAENTYPLLRAATDFASYPGVHGDDTVRQFLEQFPLPKLLGVLQSLADAPGVDETLAACLDKVFSSRYGASLLPSYGEFIQAGLLTNSKIIRQLACKAVLHLLDKAGDSVVAVDTFVQHNLYPLLINCLIKGDEEVSAIVLDVLKRLAEIPKGIDIIFPPNGQGSLLLNKMAAQSSSMGMMYRKITRTSVQLWFDADDYIVGYLVVCKPKFVYIIVGKEISGDDINMEMVFYNGQRITPAKYRSSTFVGFTAFLCSKFMGKQTIDTNAVDVIEFCKYNVSLNECVYHYTYHQELGARINRGTVTKSEDQRFEHNCAANWFSKDGGLVLNKDGHLAGICDRFEGCLSAKRASLIAESLAGFKKILKYVALLPQPSRGSLQTQESEVQ